MWKCPHLIKLYNKHMGGVDHDDWLVKKYRTSIFGKKWYWPLFTHSLDVALVNAWILHKISHHSTMDLLAFRRSVTRTLLCTRVNVQGPKKPGRLPTTSVHSRLSLSLRSGPNHHIERTENGKQRRCAFCKKTVRKQCQQCNVGLHVECFAHFHRR